MKKLFKGLGIVLLILILVFFVLALTQPKDVTITRTTLINAPQNVVFNQIVKFKNWPNWSPWIDIEPEVKLTYEGADGQAGSSYSWVGDETGSGKMTNTGVSADQMNFDLQFIKPWEGKASGFLKAEQNTNGTKVTWVMQLHSDFPMNAFGFMSDHMIGKDFENGLQLLKEYSEAHKSPELGVNDIIEKDFPATNFAIIRKTIPLSEIKTFSEEAFSSLKKIADEKISGPPCTFYFDWDLDKQTADLGPAYMVSGNDSLKGAQLLKIPTMHVCSILYKGGYANLGKAQQILGKYIEENSKNLRYNYEEYILGPANEADSNKWMTNVIFLID